MGKLAFSGGRKIRLIDADKLMDNLRANALVDVTPELEDIIEDELE